MRHEVTTSLGDGVSVIRHSEGGRLTITIGLKTGSECVLHWGLTDRSGGGWVRPPESIWPAGTSAAEGVAVRTSFAVKAPDEREVIINLDRPDPARRLAFVLHFPRENRWLRNGNKDFSIPLRGVSEAGTPEEALSAWAPGDEVGRQLFPLDGSEQLAVARSVGPDRLRIQMVCDAEPPLLLHWGLALHFRNEWHLPPEDFRPAGTSLFDQQAVRTPFAEREDLQYLELDLPRPTEGPAPVGMPFILWQPDAGGALKSQGKDLYLPLFPHKPDARLSSARLNELAEQIIGAEKGASSWTLMHRFNLCHDLLEGVEADHEALALLFVWLRYSAIRQLDWQRHYNTKPRELSHAQDQLTKRLAGIWKRLPAGDAEGKRLVRLLLTTLGRGGEGQRVRDEILHIMHRNNLKESSGTFVEEWHQKLHNNTTPDDVVICEAYLAFLRSDGKVSRFYETLKAKGVPRQRLQSFERPIKTDPVFHADKKEALIGEFENFLSILKSVHSGTDLATAASAAGECSSKELKEKLRPILPALEPPAGGLVGVPGFSRSSGAGRPAKAGTPTGPTRRASQSSPHQGVCARYPGLTRAIAEGSGPGQGRFGPARPALS